MTPVLIPATITQANILIVDDRPDGLLALEAVLSSGAYRVSKASSGHEALAKLPDNEFAVILLDVQMPVLDGFQTARLIRENSKYKETPIIFVTAISADIARIYKGYESGAVDFLFKPVDPYILRAKVDFFVDLFNKNKQLEYQSRKLREMELRDKERRMAELEVESLRRYANLADAIPEMLLKVHKDGNTEYFNQVWSRYTGLTGELTGLDWQLVIHPIDRKRLFFLWERHKRGQQHSFRLEARIRRSEDGAYRWHLINVTPEEKNNEITGWIATAMDIHDRKIVEERLRLLAEDLDRSNKELEQFAYAASHDLKEPLHVVGGYAQLLNRRYQDRLDGNAKEFFQFMLEGISRMQTLIEGLLNYSLIGKKDDVFGPVDTSTCYRHALSNLQMMIQDAGAVVTSDRLPVVTGNEVQIIQLFQNLISNAIKFRGPNLPKIHVGVEPKDRCWLFTVRDNGIGIKSEYFSRIFEIFRRLHSTLEYDGSGIGLATCKKIVERHRGSIWLDSEYGKGTTFYFKLPMRQEQYEDRQAHLVN
jgi:two-component system, sensor histidine kinase